MSYAANDDSRTLGRINKAGKTTTLERGTKGAALRLDTKAGSPPLVVTSRAKVKRINADRVDGFEAVRLASTALTFTNTFPSGVSYSDRDRLFEVEPGPQRVDINASSFLARPRARRRCTAESSPTSPPTVWGAASRSRRPHPSRLRPSGGRDQRHQGVPDPGEAHAYFSCVPDQDQFLIWDIQPLTVQFTSVTSMKSAGDLAPWIP